MRLMNWLIEKPWGFCAVCLLVPLAAPFVFAIWDGRSMSMAFQLAGLQIGGFVLTSLLVMALRRVGVI